MSCFTWYFWDGVIFICTFFLCKITGILPSHVNGRGFTLEEILHKTAGVQSSSVSQRPLYIYGIVFIIVMTACIASYNFYISTHNLPYYFDYDFELNHIFAYIIILNALLFRRRSTLKCVYGAVKLYCKCNPSLKPCWFILLSMVLYFILFVGVHVIFANRPSLVLAEKTVIIEILTLPTLASVWLICCFCLIAERSYININRQLEELMFTEPSVKTREQIKILMFYHESTTDLMDEIGESFSYDLVIHLADFTIQLIFCSYSITRLVINGDIKVAKFILHNSAIFLIRLFKFFMICFSSQQIQNQVEMLQTNIHSIKVHWLKFNCADQETLLTDFADTVQVRPVVLTAAGFTDIDLSLIFKLTGTAVMYASAALQYYLQDNRK